MKALALLLLAGAASAQIVRPVCNYPTIPLIPATPAFHRVMPGQKILCSAQDYENETVKLRAKAGGFYNGQKGRYDLVVRKLKSSDYTQCLAVITDYTKQRDAQYAEFMKSQQAEVDQFEKSCGVLP